MCLDPAMGTEIHQNAGGKQPKRDRQSTHNPGQLDAAFEHEIVKNPKHQDQDGGLCKKGGAPASRDRQKVGQGPSGMD